MLDTPNLLNILPRIQKNSMPKISKVKKKLKKAKQKIVSKTKTKTAIKNKEINKNEDRVGNFLTSTLDKTNDWVSRKLHEKYPIGSNYYFFK